jgi:hypothetical protein
MGRKIWKFTCALLVPKPLLRSYLGHASTLVGDNHYVMFVTIPTDSFDNPKCQTCSGFYDTNFLNTISTDIEKGRFYSLENVFAPKKNQIIVLISAACNAAM